jgi:hypothetical protein
MRERIAYVEGLRSVGHARATAGSYAAHSTPRGHSCQLDFDWVFKLRWVLAQRSNIRARRIALL